MKELTIPIAAALTLVGCSSEPKAPQPPRVFPTVHFELDASESNLLTADPEFARVVAVAAARHVAALPPGTKVSMRTFGAINGPNNLRYDTQINSKTNPADRVAREVGQQIEDQAQRSGPRQQSTEIMFTLGQGRYNCTAGDTVILLSDGIPSGEVNPYAVLNGTQPLPELAAGSLSGCEVFIWGLGRTSEGSLTAQEVRNLDLAYSETFGRAGAHYEAVSNP